MYFRSHPEEVAPALVGIDPLVGDLVRIDGLLSPIGQRLNGMTGRVVASSPDSDRFGVEACTQNLQVIPMYTSILIQRALAWHSFWFAEKHVQSKRASRRRNRPH